VREAAVAMGMTDRQVLFQVELPLAMSVILTGVRVAVVITIGVAIIGATVGAGGLGEFIFAGLRNNKSELLLAGAVPSALMALLADFGFSAIEKRFDTSTSRVRTSSRKLLRNIAWATVALGIVLMGYAAWRGIRWPSSASLGGAHATVASKDFTESELLAEIVAQMLEARNIKVNRTFGLGGNLSHAALVAGEIDLYPEYTGTSFTAILHHAPMSDPKAVYDQVRREYAEQFKLEVSAPLGFDNTFAILVRGEDARRLNLKTISQAARYTSQWRAGFGEDFKTRADGYPGFARAYDLQFAEEPRQMALDLSYTALASRKVDLIAGNSTDGRIAKLDLVQLEDDRHYFPPYEAVFMTRQDSLARLPALREVLQKLGGAISTDEMRKLNFEVDSQKRDKKNVVREWLNSKGLIK
jgi:osmoprotectant transport system permease protein